MKPYDTLRYPLAFLGTLLFLTGCGSHRFGYSKEAGGSSTHVQTVLKNNTISGSVYLGGHASQSNQANQGGGLSPKDSLNGNTVAPEVPKVPIEIPEIPEAPEALEIPEIPLGL